MADFDADLRAALEEDERFKGVVNQLVEASSKTVEINHRIDTACQKCGCKHIRMEKIEVPDYKTKLAIIEFLSNRGVGRPSQADGGSDAEKITFIRQVNK